MNDRELLEMAAKAIGLMPDEDTLELPGGMPAFWVDNPEPHWWNPLLDDGDALRLAVSLSLVINNRHNTVLVEDMGGIQFWQKHEGDELEATRRAIVRAAAEIERAMP